MEIGSLQAITDGRQCVMKFKVGDLLRIKQNMMVSVSAQEQYRNCLIIEISNRAREPGGYWFETKGPYLQLLLRDTSYRSVNIRTYGMLFENVMDNDEI